MKFFVIVLSLFSFSVFADQFTSRVQEIDHGIDSVLIKFENGRVAFLDPSEKSLFPQVGDRLRINVDKKWNILSGSVLEVTKSLEHDPGPVPAVSFDPTIVAGPAEATAIFGRMNRRYQRASQCYNRAHVWAYEEYKRSGLKSKKLFLFFTSSYIRKYRYKWWFHVTPMILVRENGAVVERAIDRTFTKSPRALKVWTDDFIRSKRACPVVSKYSSYRDYQQEEHCYLIPVSMYFWQPRDIENQERTGAVKTSFIQSEVKHAYKEAF